MAKKNHRFCKIQKIPKIKFFLKNGTIKCVSPYKNPNPAVSPGPGRASFATANASRLDSRGPRVPLSGSQLHQSTVWGTNIEREEGGEDAAQPTEENQLRGKKPIWFHFNYGMQIRRALKNIDAWVSSIIGISPGIQKQRNSRTAVNVKLGFNQNTTDQ